ncbi:MAG: tetratricopeptide repeat protein [Actinomycetota bacterium]
MTSNVPTVRQINWISIVPQIAIIGLLIYLYNLVNFGDPFILGSLMYLILAFGLRNIIPKDHRKAIKLVKQQKFAEAIPYFEKSYDYFMKYSWVDKYRFLTILSSSRMCYREMALCNIAFCYGQIGEGQKAKEYYQQTLTEYPENGMAQAGINMLNLVDNKLA